MDNDATGYSTTDESEHSHFCSVCHSNWLHADELCAKAPDYDCPACVDWGQE